MPIPTTGVPVMDLVKEYSNIRKLRTHWLTLSEFDIIRVCRYMLDFGKEKDLSAHDGFLRHYLLGWIEDSVEQIKVDGDSDQRWSV